MKIRLILTNDLFEVIETKSAFKNVVHSEFPSFVIYTQN